MKPIISSINDGSPSDVLRLAPDGTLSTADDSSVQERLAELYRLWVLEDHRAEGLQPVNVVHRRHLLGLWKMVGLMKKLFPESFTP